MEAMRVPVRRPQRSHVVPPSRGALALLQRAPLRHSAIVVPSGCRAVIEAPDGAVTVLPAGTHQLSADRHLAVGAAPGRRRLEVRLWAVRDVAQMAVTMSRPGAVQSWMWGEVAVAVERPAVLMRQLERRVALGDPRAAAHWLGTVIEATLHDLALWPEPAGTGPSDVDAERCTEAARSLGAPLRSHGLALVGPLRLRTHRPSTTLALAG
jgi:hypothetical protein